jgi:hypothetical protein
METSWIPSRMLRKSSSATNSVVVEAFAAGFLIGAGVALLLAPKTGAEMRLALARRFSFDKNEEFADKVREHGGLPGPFKHLAP